MGVPLNADSVLVFDTTPLRHLAIHNALLVLKAVVGDRRAVMTDMVAEELRVAAVHHREVQAALEAAWLERYVLDADCAEYRLFAANLVRGERNRGEASVLAVAHVLGGMAVIDDAAGRKAAQKHKVPLVGTLGLLYEALMRDPPLLTVALLEVIFDELVSGDYRIKRPPGGFREWAADNSLPLPES